MACSGFINEIRAEHISTDNDISLLHLNAENSSLLICYQRSTNTETETENSRKTLMKLCLLTFIFLSVNMAYTAFVTVMPHADSKVSGDLV